jgi:hypothetical protein
MKGFDQRIKYFGGEGYVLGHKGYWIEYNRGNKENTQEGII